MPCDGDSEDPSYTSLLGPSLSAVPVSNQHGGHGGNQHGGDARAAVNTKHIKTHIDKV